MKYWLVEVTDTVFNTVGIHIFLIANFRPMEFLLNALLFLAIPCIVFCGCIGSIINYCMAYAPKRNKDLHNNIDAKKCFSSQDIQVSTSKTK